MLDIQLILRRVITVNVVQWLFLVNVGGNFTSVSTSAMCIVNNLPIVVHICIDSGNTFIFLYFKFNISEKETEV